MPRSLIQSVSLTAAAVAVAVFASAVAPGFATPAEAKKVFVVKSGFGGHHFHRHGYGRSFVVVSGLGYGYGYRECYWLKLRALDTGSPYAWARYNACIRD